MLHSIIMSVYRFFMKQKIIRQLRKQNMLVTDFEWEPEGYYDGNLRVWPVDDSLTHSTDDCPCNPEHTEIVRDDGTTYTRIVHHRMSQ